MEPEWTKVREKRISSEDAASFLADFLASAEYGQFDDGNTNVAEQGEETPGHRAKRLGNISDKSKKYTAADTVRLFRSLRNENAGL